METFVFKTREELLAMSEKERKDYIKFLKQKCRDERAATKKIKADTERIKLETARLQSQLDEVKKENLRLLRERGWEELPEEVIAWLMKDDNYRKHFYFKPTAQRILERYAEINKTEVIVLEMDPKFKGLEEFQSTNAWVSPDGTFYGMGDFAKHEEWASNYAHNKYAREECDEFRKKYGYYHIWLEANSWIRILTWTRDNTTFSRDSTSRITKRQADTIRTFCSLHNVKEPTFIQ